ncbi:MAG: hypothetical protein AB7O28_21120 [Vicinamibacterales bacterium]
MSPEQPSRPWPIRLARHAGWRRALVVGALVLATLAAGMSVLTAMTDPVEVEQSQSSEIERDLFAPVTTVAAATPPTAARDLGPHGADATALPAPVLDVPENPPERA